MSLIQTDAPAILPTPGPETGKRALDLVCLALAAPLVLPLMAAIWLALLLTGGQPIFRQVRVGRDGQRFTMWKFRSMVPDADAALRRLCAEDQARAAEWRLRQKLKDDPRITRLGRILRKTSLDELPQLVNVLTGEMSLVGPRPFTTDQEQLYRDAGGRAYFRMRPGLTGLWQVHGRDSTAFEDRVTYDERYFGTRSLTLDLRVMLRTATVMTRGT
ncbi:sugar transferase [Palleronia abyssalis]|uniref:UDP-glucose:undecaprenyl-phosphate glucose-1-phosphate transferase n=1 Tax=Palleronia abyssalis TaxID=1501240 RepID=A0A2R8BXT2_9RHOB|nr:sugar transferase [Palleronia abyssalis]SPJ24960.1 UDP-glucose:undecaprenyl-phosphate glucose-1-phosphate transferase [Palleronia abyssalis]